MLRNAYRSLAAAALSLVASLTFGADILWPSHQWGEPNNAPFMLELKKTFEQENPGVTVKNVTVPQAIFFDKQFADVSSGNPADVVTLYDPDLRAYLEHDVLEPLDGYIKAAGIDTSSFIPTAKLAEKGGKTYAVPFQINARALFYNEKLLREAGLQPPKTLTEFQAAIKKLRKEDLQQFGFATVSKPGSANFLYIEIMPIVVGFGGGFFKDGKPNANAPETIAALRFIKNLYDEQLIPRGMEPNAYRQMFAQGKVAMYATGGFLAATVDSTNKETYASLRAEALPLPSGKAMSITVFLGVPKAAKNKELAAKLLMRMLQDDMQRKIVVMGKTLPARVGMVPADFAKENVWFPAFEQAAKTAKSYAPEGAEQYGPEIYKLVSEHVEAMLFNGVAAEEAANNLQKALVAFAGTKQR